MSSPWRRIPTTFIAVCFLAFSISMVRGEEDLKQQFLEQAPKAWEALEGFDSQLAGTFTKTESYKDGKKPTKTTKNDFAVSGKMGRMRQEGGPDGEKVGAMNSQYFFTLRKASEPNYAVNIIEPYVGDAKATEHAEGKIANSLHQYVFAPWYYDLKPLGYWLKQPGFKIDRATPVGRTGKNLVRVDFSYDPPAGIDSRLAVLPSWFLFDPSAYWSIQAYDIQKSWGNIIGNIEYGDRIDGFPVQKQIVEYVRDKQGGELKVVVDFNKLERKVVPESEFTLSAFGLPEPTFKSPVHRGFQIFLLAIACGIVAICLRVYFRKKAAAVQQQP